MFIVVVVNVDSDRGVFLILVVVKYVLFEFGLFLWFIVVYLLVVVMMGVCLCVI